MFIHESRQSGEIHQPSIVAHALPIRLPEAPRASQSPFTPRTPPSNHLQQDASRLVPTGRFIQARHAVPGRSSTPPASHRDASCWEEPSHPQPLNHPKPVRTPLSSLPLDFAHLRVISRFTQISGTSGNAGPNIQNRTITTSHPTLTPRSHPSKTPPAKPPPRSSRAGTSHSPSPTAPGCPRSPAPPPPAGSCFPLPPPSLPCPSAAS